MWEPCEKKMLYTFSTLFTYAAFFNGKYYTVFWSMQIWDRLVYGFDCTVLQKFSFSCSSEIITSCNSESNRFFNSESDRFFICRPSHQSNMLGMYCQTLCLLQKTQKIIYQKTNKIIHLYDFVFLIL